MNPTDPTTRETPGGMAYIRSTYKVPAKRGGRIIYGASDGEDIEGVITAARYGKLRVRLIGNDSKPQRKSVILHPTWNITYLP